MCQHNPRTCKHAPCNELAHEIRTAILRWPAQRKALVAAIRKLCNLKIDEDSREVLHALNEIQCIFKTIEAALVLHASSISEDQ